MTISMIIAAVLIAMGFLFMLASLTGLVMFPDFFARLHAQGVGDTIGAFLILAGMIAAVGASLLSVKILLIFIIIVLTNPIGTNLMMIAAINKEDYQGYSTFMAGGAEEEKPAADRKTGGHDKPDDNMPKADSKKPAADRKTGGQDKPADNKTKADSKKPAAEQKAGDSTIPAAEKSGNENAGNKQKEGKRPRSRKRKPSMNMNRTELLEAAAERGIEVPEEATKREILDLIYSSHDKNRR